jgi:release factor glutamine methyltransferase
MRKIVKYLVRHTYKPVLENYLSKTRRYSYKGICLEIPAGVFHPRFFYSTKFLLNHIMHEQLTERSLLELGAGSGLVSIYAAFNGAIVTATDINPVAVNCLKKNMADNNVNVDVLQSDLFNDIPIKPYKFILLNPPFYKKDPESYSEFAWYCGKNGEYFHKLFANLHLYLDDGSKVYMVLCEGCDLGMIAKSAANHHFNLHCVATGSRFMEKHFIFQIQPFQCVN